MPQLQFFDQSGRPLSFGCVFTYQSQTTNQLATYTDFSGKATNPNPVILSIGGSANIWLQAGQAYTFIVKSAGGTQCSLGTTQYTIDGIGGGQATLTTIVTASGGSATFNGQSQNQLFTMTLTGNVIAQPLTGVGIVPPGIMTFQLTQDNVGGHSFTWPTNAINPGPVCTLATCTTLQTFIWDGTNATAVGAASYSIGPASAVNLLYSTAFASLSANPAAAGVLRLSDTDTVNWRNHANGADVALSKNTSDHLVWPNGLSLGGATVLASTNQSGTGALCMVTNCAMTTPTLTSPTLVTPALGVATATSYACPVASKTTTYTLTTSDCIIQADVTGGSFTLTLPHAATGQIWRIVRVDTSTNNLTINGDSGNVSGKTSIQLPSNMTAVCHADGTNSWCTSNNTRDFSVTGCTTATSTDSSCTGTISISPPFADSSYIPALTINSVNGAFVAVSVSGSLTSSSIPYTITCTFNCASIVAPTIYIHAYHP